MTYKRLTDVLANLWDNPWESISVEQRDAWTRAFSQNYRVWDTLGASQRKQAAEQYDLQHDPAMAGANHVVWYDGSLNASQWFSMGSVSPRDAAMLLCQLDPLDNSADPLTTSSDQTDPGDFNLLEKVFKDVASTSPKHRTLMEWRAIAQGRGLRYHDWIDKYAQAAGKQVNQQVVGTVQTRVPVATQQNDAIITWLKSNSYDPEKLPVPSNGKPGVKKDCHDYLCTNIKELFSSKSVFNTAWERLRKNAKIKDAT